ncbi:MAG: 1,4-alpha-glucan branching enzyme [Myxococcales bacterium]|nr:1,4-alpha-glucan branching enzyme [Myxococcales bacterium]
MSPRPSGAKQALRAGISRVKLASLMGALRARSFLFPAVARAALAGAALVACGASAGPESKDPTTPEVPGPPGPTATAPAAPPAPAPIATPPSGLLIGATPYEGGVEVRVWAPNAKAVAVAGEIAGAGAARRALAPEAGTGMFDARIDGAHAGQRYHFVITAQDGSEVTRVDPRARMTDGNESVVVDPRTYAWKSKPFTPPARDASVVYELHVGSFNAPNGMSTGSFTTAIDKLDALVDLGINAVELMPVNGHGGNGWGYGPQQWFAPQPSYGAPDELRHFVDEAHARGIAVLLDVVFNHYDGYNQAPLRCFDGTCPGTSAGIYFFEQDPYRKTPWGPRPAFSKKEVADFFADNVFAWTTEYRIDGFRHDSVSNIRALDGQGTVPGGVEVLRRMNDVVAAARPGALLVAEDLKGAASVTAPASAGGLGFVSQWDGGFQWAVTSAATSATDDARNIGAVRDALVGDYNGDAMQRLLYVETHDTAGNDGARLPVRIDGADPTSYAARKRAMLAAGVLLTAPGVPMLFMGQEMLESTKFVPEPAPLDWSKATANAPVRAFYKDMIRLRRDLDGVSGGLRGTHITVTQVNETPGNKVLVYRRWNTPGDDVMVIANFGAKRYTRYDVGVPAVGTWVARVDTDATTYGADFGSPTPTGVTVAPTARDGLPATASIVLGPYAMVVLTR